MCLSFIYVFTSFLTFTKGQLNSYEGNQLDLTPFHDAIIFNDIADILNNVDNNMGFQMTKNLFSDSDEDVEDLLSEYQHYLDKAHKQRLDYIEKTKDQNRVPLIRDEKYTNLKNKYDIANDYFNDIKYPQKLSEPIKLFMEHNAKLSTEKKSEYTEMARNYKENQDTLIENEKRLLNLIPTIYNAKQTMSSCICKVSQIPCKCGCKQCIILTDTSPTSSFKKYNNQNLFVDNSKYEQGHKINNFKEDKLNIRIKIDVKLPKIFSILESIFRYQNPDKIIESEGVLSKEVISNIYLPFPYQSYSTPLDYLGQKKMFKNIDNSAVYKISIQKNKKPRLSENSKKPKVKKIITFHNINQDYLKEYNTTDEKNIVKNSSVDSPSKSVDLSTLQTNKAKKYEIISEIISSNSVTESSSKNINDTMKTVFSTDITLKISNDTNEVLKLENNVETDFIKRDNNSNVKPLRLKRETFHKNIKTAVMTRKASETNVNYTKDIRKIKKYIPIENELLYWPIESTNVTMLKSKTITTIILDKERKKAKLNMTYDKIHSNRTMALEKAIFGNIDWNDVDTVAPVFMSFVGKYVTGVLTLCSQSVCHSIKCSEKICHHRICTPNNRFNRKGHCTGNNDSDRVAAMESVMNLPSNIGFEIVDILHDKMIGKLYGQATICILSKCRTFVASKKNFNRSKCTSKELNPLGHCPIVENVKIT